MKRGGGGGGNWKRAILSNICFQRLSTDLETRHQSQLNNEITRVRSEKNSIDLLSDLLIIKNSTNKISL